MSELKKGDMIKCRDKEDMLNLSLELGRLKIKHDYVFEKDGEKGLWVEILGEMEE